MAHFEDLTEYRYAGRFQPGVLHIGWLGEGRDYSRGAVAPHLVERLRQMAQEPQELYRGYHVCELCEMPAELRGRPFTEQWDQWAQFRKSNGEIRIVRGAVTYAAPVLITHYIEVHGYCPPAEFLKAVEEEPNQAMQTTPRSVTCCACAQPAPARSVSDLERSAK